MCEAVNPPAVAGSAAFPNHNILLYVPAASVESYKAADVWKNFTTILPISATGVEENTVDESIATENVAWVYSVRMNGAVVEGKVYNEPIVKLDANKKAISGKTEFVRE